MFLRQERRPMLAWAVGLGAFVLLLGSVYASFEDPTELNKIVENYPEELLEIFGGFEDIGTIEGFLGAELGGYFSLLIGIFAVMLATKHLAGAEEAGRLDHLLARPITRGAYYWELLLAGTLILSAMLVGAALGGMIGFSFAGASLTDLVGILGMMLEFLPLGVFYLALGALTGAAFHRRGRANGIGIAAVIAFFAVDLVARLVDGMAWLSYVTPEGYLRRSNLFNGELDLGYLLFTGLLALLVASVGAWLFERKDLYA